MPNINWLNFFIVGIGGGVVYESTTLVLRGHFWGILAAAVFGFAVGDRFPIRKGVR